MAIRFLMALLVGAFFVPAYGKGAAVVPTGANGYKVVFGSTGQPLATTTTVGAGAMSGEALIRDMFKAPGPSGGSIPMGAKRSIPWGTIGRAVGRASPYIVGGMIIYELFDQYRVRPDGSTWEQDKGAPPGKKDAFSCTYGDFSGQGLTKGGACLAAVAKYQAKHGHTRECYWGSGHFCNETLAYSLGGYKSETDTYEVMVTITVGPADPSVKTILAGYAVPVATPIDQCKGIPGHPNPAWREDGGPTIGTDGKCPTGVYQDISQSEAETIFDRGADKSRASEYVRELLDKDVKFEPSPAVELDGPAKVELEPKTKTETDAQGNTKTTTTQDVYNITYQGDSYTWNQTTITVNPDGSKVEEEKPPEATPPPDVELGQHPKLYERKYPDGLAGVWRDNAAAFANTPVFQFLKGLNPNLSTGGCPKFGISGGTVLGISVGGDVSPPCEVWSFLRVFFVLCALLLSRRLIFGG